MTDKLKLAALAMLKLEHKPRDIADKLGISYGTVLKYSKELIEAERRNDVLSLFALPELALAELLDTVRNNYDGLLTVLGVDSAPLVGELEQLGDGIRAMQGLEVDLATAASKLSRKLAVMTDLTTEANELYTLCEALSKLQTAFFAKGTTVQVANISGGLPNGGGGPNEFLSI